MQPLFFVENTAGDVKDDDADNDDGEDDENRSNDDDIDDFDEDNDSKSEVNHKKKVNDDPQKETRKRKALDTAEEQSPKKKVCFYIHVRPDKKWMKMVPYIWQADRVGRIVKKFLITQRYFTNDVFAAVAVLVA